ncbi:MAG: hypothetical protein AAFY06_07790 [Pseudomonadota bacterium]
MVISVDPNGDVFDDPVTAGALGGEYLGWTGFPGWQVQAEHFGIHHIRWPAGINAEDRIEAGGYAFDIATPTLVDNWPKSNGAPREGLTDMFAYANETNVSFAMIVPTARYVDMMATDPNGASAWIASDVAAFTTRLFAGEFGPIPLDFVLEIGAEYYSTDAWAALASNPDAEELFAQVFAELVTAFRDAETTHGQDVYSVAVQAARFQSNDDTASTQDGELADADAFLAAYAEHQVEDAIDALIWHRYVYLFDQTSHHLTPGRGEQTLTDHLALWEQALGHELDLVLGWAAPDIDSNGAYPVDPNFDFGPRAAHSTLQMFSELAEVGTDYATLYGIDSPWTGAISTGSTSASVYSVLFHGEVYAMMTESLVGLRPTDAFLQNSVPVGADNAVVEKDHVNVFGFTNEVDHHVTFAAAWDLTDESTVTISAPDVAADYIAVTQLRPVSVNADAGGFYVSPRASTDAAGAATVTGVGDFDVLRVSHTAEAGPLEAWQTLLHAQTGRGVISLSETDDTFDFLDMNDRAADAGDGNDVISGSMLADIIVGGEGQDSLDGGAGDDIIVGDGVDPQMLLDWLDGSDFIFG